MPGSTAAPPSPRHAQPAAAAAVPDGDAPGGAAHDVAEVVRRRAAALVTEDVDAGRVVVARVRDAQRDMARFRMVYEFGIEEMLTKIRVLRSEFRQTHDHNPIEHVTSRLKSMDSILDKTMRYGCASDLPTVRERIRDIAGIRITCSFVSDAYWVADMLSAQPDVELVERKDYIAHPKPNGYRSLHLIVRIPVFLSDRTEHVYVEVQIRTIAMDFWASVEHKLSYKYRDALPTHLRDELLDAAATAAELDARMGRLRAEVQDLGTDGAATPAPSSR
ncbi:GTP pyrophosphokinase family protein [Cellulomonas sp. zg-ZUI222]|uniref:GTP pyrophosphokinase family protein n=1 Tax=Cellulomonas wangleii TaxID=2816956 RepID=A0ABX8D7Q7_9CELL|nr:MULTISPECIES: GTP pyrophosphokinase family protein [Cellulomonas]MBO0900984.1 GTP pyrophosphokinase family protein [Cellulomonas sp. zg-ZUI22]MBO0921639.1 GTP pyrophosphokinase family protein [Cellulomonas wangleii]MBO0925135.1 GTP pyrophosphokinase family protein [Cellulomonas wangleii]QVI63457.1 GTP pyrophosphokinase family protein [Cellulomonas wangleii]